MDFITEPITWPTTTEQTWIEEAEKIKDIFFQNSGLSDLKLSLPLGYRLAVEAKIPQNLWMLTSSNRKKKSKEPRLSSSYYGITLKPSTDIDKTSVCSYTLGRVNEIKKDLLSTSKQIVKIDFMEIEFHQNKTEMVICFSQKLPPVSFKGELNDDTTSMDIPLEYQIQPDSVIIKYYFADFSKIRDRLNDFIRASSVFYTVYCRQPSLTEREDTTLEVKWS